MMKGLEYIKGETWDWLDPAQRSVISRMSVLAAAGLLLLLAHAVALI